MPKAIPLGTSYDDFWRLNPRKINVMIKAYNESKKNELRQANMLLHLEGMYFADALLSTVGNMFRGKGQQAFKYPSEPYDLNLDFEKGLDISDETERDIAIKRRNFVTNLNNMFRNIDKTLQERNDGNR